MGLVGMQFDGPFEVSLEIDPPRSADPFDVPLRLWSTGQTPVAGAQITGSYWSAAGDWPPVDFLVNPGIGPGDYLAEGIRLDRNGTWSFQFDITANDQHGRVVETYQYENSLLP